MAYVDPVFHGGRNYSEQITDEFLSCRLCFQPGYKQPKLLPCGHTFCQPCLDGYLGYPRESPNRGTTCGATTGEKKVFPCPCCGVQNTIPRKGVAGFRDNLFVDIQVDRLLRRHNKERGRDDTRYNINCYQQDGRGHATFFLK